MVRTNRFLDGCLSCDIVQGKIREPGGTIYEDDCWQVGSVLAPLMWRGFLIVKLKRHCEHIAELAPQEAASLGPVLRAGSQALSEVLRPAKVYVCSFGDGIKHIHFWLLPRPAGMAPGMHSVIFQLDLRMTLTRLLKVQRWIVPDEEIQRLADALKASFRSGINA